MVPGSCEKSEKVPWSFQVVQGPRCHSSHLMLFSPYCVYTSVARNTVLHTAVRIFSPISAHIAAVVCSSLPVKGTPQYQLQPLLSFRGSITSQTCPVLLPPLWNLSYPWEDHETFGVFYRLKIFLPSMSTHIPSTDGEYKATLAAHISSPPLFA